MESVQSWWLLNQSFLILFSKVEKLQVSLFQGSHPVFFFQNPLFQRFLLFFQLANSLFQRFFGLPQEVLEDLEVVFMVICTSSFASSFASLMLCTAAFKRSWIAFKLASVLGPSPFPRCFSLSQVCSPSPSTAAPSPSKLPWRGTASF